MKTLKRILFFIAGICLLIACSKSDGFFGHDSFENDLKKDQYERKGHDKYSPGTVYSLTGFAPYRTWEVKGGKVWQDVRNPCTATLEFFKDHNFKFTFTEPPKPPIPCLGKMGDSGTLTFKYPVPLMVFPDGTSMNITDVIQMHACATIWGEGINEGTLVFKGKFDGNKFTATAKFMASVASPCPSNNMFDPALVNGNLHWTFGYDLTVVE